MGTSNSRLAAVVAVGVFALSAGSAAAATCNGNCGVGTTADGVVTLAPGGTGYQWISTDGGIDGVGQISSVGGTNGSTFQSTSFSANAGDSLDFYFNYVTADGSGEFTDYAWAALTDAANVIVNYLFTARTTPSGDTSPGFGLPSNGATLTPASTPIIPGGPTFSPLGISSGDCYDTGCGYTGWIGSSYTITSDGIYSLLLGVTNFGDTAVDSALAWAGATIDDTPIDPVSTVPVPATLPLLGTALLGFGLWGKRKSRKSA